MTNKENTVLIITGGQIEEAFLANQVIQESYSMIIAADRGLIMADRLGLELDFIVGDFDSVSEAILKKYHDISTPIQTFPTEKDKTDTQIAIELALMHNPTKMDIVGATGSRLDHVMANIHLLMLPMQLGVPACILDTNNRIYLQRDSFMMEKEQQFGDYISLLPFHSTVSGLTLKGFKYPLNSITLTAGSSLGISNEIIAERAAVEFNAGILVVVEAKD